MLLCCVHARVQVCAHEIVKQAVQGVSFSIQTDLDKLRGMDVVRMDDHNLKNLYTKILNPDQLR